MKFSALQMNTRSEKTANLEQARSIAAQAMADDAPDMLVLPEVFAFMGGSITEKRAAAEELPAPGEVGGPAYEMLRGIASDHGVFVHGGSFVERAGDEYFNTTIAFDRGGAELARYRKIHLFDVSTPDGREYRESAAFGAGREIVTYAAGDITVGCSICYDLRFAELYCALAERGAEVHKVALYRRKWLQIEPERLAASIDAVDAVIVTSGEALTHLLDQVFATNADALAARLAECRLVAPSARVVKQANQRLSWTHAPVIVERIGGDAIVASLARVWKGDRQ